MQSLRADALAGRHAVVTGGSRGIGAAIASRLALCGASVTLVSNDEPGMDSVVGDIRMLGGAADYAVVDLRDPRAIADFADSLPAVDFLVNNAAPPQGRDPFLDTDDDMWDLQLDIILRASVRLIQRIGRKMAERNTGAIVNLSSKSVQAGAPFATPYAAAKAGLEVVTRMAALELGPHGVRVNAIRPSFIPTARVAHLANDEDFLAAAAAKVPLGRLATPEDIAAATCWLCSDDASFITGTVITVDGGTSAKL